MITKPGRVAGRVARVLVQGGVLGLVTLGLVGAAPPAPPARVALVVGVASYSQRPLKNSVSDAKAVAEQLSALGFKVNTLYDRPGRDLGQALESFKKDAAKADAAVIYFAGHGMELSGQNYLLPSDAQFDAARLVSSSVFAGRLRDGVSKARSLRLVILDACRNNPLEQAGLPVGLARETGGDSGDVVTLMAAQPGKMAYDGLAGNHSPFVLALVAALKRPGVTVGEMASYLQSEVRHRVADPRFQDQIPDQQGIWGNPNWSFDPRAEAGTAGPAFGARLQAEKVFWESIRDSSEPDDFRTYLKEADNGRFTGLYITLAYNRIDRLSAAQPAPAVSRVVSSSTPARPSSSPPSSQAKAFDMAATLERGRAALARADYPAAVTEWQAAAQAGSAIAMSNLGLASVYGYGRPGGKPDMAAAAAWFEKSAKAGNPSGMVNYAALLLNSRGVAQDGVRRDVAAGLKWLTDAAKAGNPTAMQTLGEIYARGERLPRDYAQAATWMTRAVDAGDGQALTNLAYWYEGGVILPKDLPRALGLYERAARAGRSAAMLRLGEFYEDGEGVNRDPLQAATWYQRAVETGNVEALAFLGGLYETGRGVRQDQAQAMSYYRRGAKAGDAKAQQALQRLGVRD